MVGTGNPLFFYIFYRFTNGILLGMRRKTKIKPCQGNASRLASLLRWPQEPGGFPLLPAAARQGQGGEHPGDRGAEEAGWQRPAQLPACLWDWDRCSCLPGAAPALPRSLGAVLVGQPSEGGWAPRDRGASGEQWEGRRGLGVPSCTL